MKENEFAKEKYQEYIHAIPFPHIVIDNLFDASFISEVSKEFPKSEIDKEVKEILDDCYETAKEVLEKNIDILHKMSQALMDYETLDVDQIDDIMAGGDPRAPKSTEEPPSKDSKKSPVGDAAEQN